MPKTIAPPKLVKEAAEYIEMFRASWRAIKENYLIFGEACTVLEGRELYKYVPKDKSRQGYLSFDELVATETGGDCARSTVMEAKRIYRLTLGPEAVSREAVLKMPRKNQLRVAKALHDVEKAEKKLPPKARQELIEKAQTENTLKFAATATHIVNEQLPVEKQQVALVKWTLTLNPSTVEKAKNLIEDLKLTPVVRSVMRDLDMESACVETMIHATRLWMSETIESSKRKARDEAPIIPDQAKEAAPAIPEAYSAPDADQAIAAAEIERRSIKRPDADALPN